MKIPTALLFVTYSKKKKATIDYKRQNVTVQTTETDYRELKAGVLLYHLNYFKTNIKGFFKKIKIQSLKSFF